MFDVIFLAAVFKYAGCQTFSFSRPVSEGTSVTLYCTTNDFGDSIFFQLNAASKGGCLTGAGGICNTGITGYQTPTRQGTTVTAMSITSYTQSRDGGSWTCSYGLLKSPAVTLQYDVSNSGGSRDDNDLPAKAGGGGGGGGGTAIVITIIVIAIVYRKGKKWAKVGDSVVFDCAATSLPGDVKWKHNNNVIESNSIFNTGSKNNPSLKVHFVDVDETGKYTCMVGDKLLKTYQLNIRNPDYKVVSGETITLLPGMRASNGITKIEWKKGLEIILTQNSSSKYTGATINEPPLTIKNVQHCDAGVYICTVYLDETKKILDVNLVVDNGKIEANVGDSVDFYFGASSLHSEFEWTKDNCNVKETGNIIHQLSGVNNKMLKIHFLEDNNGGQYICMVGKKQMKKYQLKVCNPNYTVVIGKPITLLPGMRSNYNVRIISWKKDSMPISTDGNSSRYSGGIVDELPLTIKNAQLCDKGVYSCTVDFKDGSHQKQFIVKLTVENDKSEEE